MAAYEICQSLIEKRPKKAKNGQKWPKMAKKVTEKKAKKNMTMKENTNPIAHEFITF